MKAVSGYERILADMMRRGLALNPNQKREYSTYFDIEVYPDTQKIKSYKRNSKAIDAAVEQGGFHILVTSYQASCSEAIEAYQKRDCVEKTFKALKSDLGMDALRGHSDANIDGRFFILFIASILRAVTFHVSSNLREKDRKNYTVNAIIKELSKVFAIIDTKTGKYNRRYKLSAKQKNIFSCLDLSEHNVDEFANSIQSSYNS